MMLSKIAEWTLAIFLGAIIALPLAAAFLFVIYVLILGLYGGTS